MLQWLEGPNRFARRCLKVGAAAADPAPQLAAVTAAHDALVAVVAPRAHAGVTTLPGAAELLLAGVQKRHRMPQEFLRLKAKKCYEGPVACHDDALLRHA